MKRRDRKKTAGLSLLFFACFALTACGGGSNGTGATPSAAPTITSVNVVCNPTIVQSGRTSACSAAVQGTGNFDSSVTWSVDLGSINSSGLYTATGTAGVATIKATSVQASTQFGTAALTATARTTADRPDDMQGNQVHVLYVVPSDGADNSYDLDGRIATSVESWEQWFAGQTSGSRIRLDTFHGALDITFVRLGRTDAQMGSYQASLTVWDQLEAELLERGFTVPNKIYLAYFDGGGVGITKCGASGLPPTKPGTVSALYLNGTPTGAPPCSSNPLTISATSPGYLEFSAIHEIMHTLGIVPSCAPHTTTGHVSDSNTDLMYSGSLPWMPSVLDFNHDDYFLANIPGCLDLSRSDFLDPLPQSATSPPGWPYTILPALSCAIEGTARSTGTQSTHIEFANNSGATVNIYWLDGIGARHLYKTLAPFEGYTQGTSASTYWIATDSSGQCIALYLAASNVGRAIVP